MYKITGITDKRGNVRRGIIRQIKKICPTMRVTIFCPEYLEPGARLCLMYEGSESMLRSSPLIEYTNDGNKIKAVTQNSVYQLERLPEEASNAIDGGQQEGHDRK